MIKIKIKTVYFQRFYQKYKRKSLSFSFFCLSKNVCAHWSWKEWDRSRSSYSLINSSGFRISLLCIRSVYRPQCGSRSSEDLCGFVSRLFQNKTVDYFEHKEWWQNVLLQYNLPYIIRGLTICLEKRNMYWFVNSCKQITTWTRIRVCVRIRNQIQDAPLKRPDPDGTFSGIWIINITYEHKFS